MIRKDIKTDAGNVPIIENGDFTYSASNNIYVDGFQDIKNESDEQDVAKVITSNTGSWREYPAFGCNLIQFANAPLTPIILQKIRQSLKSSIEFSSILRVKKLEIGGTGEITLNYTSVQ